jgi:hypothetical protein
LLSSLESRQWIQAIVFNAERQAAKYVIKKRRKPAIFAPVIAAAE